jgi:hypothetical protein
MAARAVLAVIAVATVIGLTACASATPGRTTAASTGQRASAGAGHTASAGASASQQPTATGQASAGASLCANDRGVDRVVVSRGSSPHERGDGRRGPTGPWHAPEQRADGAVTRVSGCSYRTVTRAPRRQG